ncbi:amidase family protein [Nonomuraea sp. NPDC049709]|uniref:amidase n=1 Tax=Nonomuraea sp. NPDC049709 TaxID=3154736 RepID=UPI003435AA63
MSRNVLDLVHRHKTGETTVTETVRDVLERLEGLHARIGAVAAIDPGRSLTEAARADRRLRAGAGRLLEGVPITVKDWIDVAGWPVTGATGTSRGDPGRRPAADATAVARLRQAGAIVVAISAAMADNAVYGPTRNPLDPSRAPGGSSSGTAALVAAGAVPLGLGSDSGGSVRLPAAWCGIAGLKPTFGRVPLTGHFPRCGALEDGRTAIGPLATCVRDLALALAVIAGPDGLDAGVAPVPLGDPDTVSLAGLRVGIMTPSSDWSPASGASQGAGAFRASGASPPSGRLPAPGRSPSDPDHPPAQSAPPAERTPPGAGRSAPERPVGAEQAGPMAAERPGAGGAVPEAWPVEREGRGPMAAERPAEGATSPRAVGEETSGRAMEGETAGRAMEGETAGRAAVGKEAGDLVREVKEARDLARMSTGTANLVRVGNEAGDLARVGPDRAEDPVRAAVEMLAEAGAVVVEEPVPDVREEALELTRRHWGRAGLSGAEHAWLLWDWDRFRRRMLAATAHLDLLITPAAPSPPPPWRESTESDYVWTLPWSLTGAPVVVVPSGTAGGRPGAVQVVARPWEDHVALAAALLIERGAPHRNPCGADPLGCGG